MAERVTVEQLRRILIEVAGEPDIGAENGVADAVLEDLGYDSVAVLEAVGRIERDHGVKVDEDEVFNAKKLSEVVELVNRDQA